MFLHRIAENLRRQNWTAIALDFVIVVVGVFLGMQVSNWNQARAEKAETERMLAQLKPELRTQLEFFDSVGTYFQTTRRYADEALAGWRGDPKISDEQFVIAAYQASQITAISINPDSWSLTFGGEQLRGIENKKIRRDLEITLTADYSPVEYNAIAKRYREQVRHVMPIAIQDRIRAECGDRTVWGKYGGTIIVLPTTCKMKIDPAAAHETAAALRARADLANELNWHLAAVATYMTNAEILAAPMHDLEHELTRSSSSEGKAR